MNKLIIVSNRLPIQTETINGKTIVKSGSGGLASAVGSVSRRMGAKWIGSLGGEADAEVVAAARRQQFYPVEIPAQIYANYYDHFSNRVLWPVVHGFKPYDDPQAYWDDYLAANERFADEVERQARPGDLIWVHDYHLFMLPKLLRERGLQNRIGFFLHTPFPESDFFAADPIGRQITESLLAVDSLGLQTRRSLDRFRMSLRRLGVRLDWAKHRIRYQGRELFAGAFPIGIDFGFFSRRPDTGPEFYERTGPKKDEVKQILSLSRLDYTKGIPQQLDAIAQLAARPDLQGSFVFRLVVIPSRDQQPEYHALKTDIEAKVTAINAAASGGWQPVAYDYGSLDPEVLKATYRQSHIMLVTPLADGMNLVAKEYLAANARGTLILSREAGAAEQLTEATLVDPHYPVDIADAVEQALLMKHAPLHATRRLRQGIRRDDVFNWADNFLRSLTRLSARPGRPVVLQQRNDLTLVRAEDDGL